jgi:hypothetical protein
MNEKRVKGYPFDEVQTRTELVLRTFEYDLPFNYPNVTVWRKKYDGGEFHGVELITQNEPIPPGQLTRIEPGKWMLVKTVFTVPPEVAKAQFLIVAGNQFSRTTVSVSDAFAGVVPEEWYEHDDIPATVKNLISNPTFSGKPEAIPGWNKWAVGDGSISQVENDEEGRPGVKLENFHGGLHTDIAVAPGQRVIFTLRVKSSDAKPKVFSLYPNWQDKQGRQLNDTGGDCIIITEDEPIVRVAVIGSACTPPGYVMLEVEPEEEFYRRNDFIRCTAPVRFKQSGLWGMHLRYDQWATGANADFGFEPIPPGMLKRYPGMAAERVKAGFQQFPFTGMSCAVFEIPKSRKVIIQGGSETTGWLRDNAGNDDHYSFRTIRITTASVKEPGK